MIDKSAPPSINNTNSNNSLSAYLDLISNPEKLEAARTELDRQIVEKEQELTRLRNARSALGESASTPDENPKSSFVALPTRGRRAPQAGRGRPIGPNKNHTAAILAALKGKRNGLSLSELYDALMSSKHEVEKKTVSTYLGNMQKRKELIREGEAGSFRYRLG